MNFTKNSLTKERMQQIVTRGGIVIAFFVLCAILSFSNEFFLTWGNMVNVLRQISINGILAVGMTYVILTKGIDLSVGSILACSGIVAASFLTGSDPSNVFIGIAIGLLTGIALGTINGVMIAHLSIPPFVATLGMLSAARGLTFIYNNGTPVSNLSKEFRSIAGTGDFLGIPSPVILLALVFFIFWFILRYTTFGRYIYAVGGNEKSAKTSGISVKKIVFSVYVISGFLSGLAGCVLAARTSSALPQAGVAYELDAIAAVVIGGTSLAGGTGSLIGTLFGVLIIGVINNGLDLMGVSSYYQQVIKGIIIVSAVLLDPSRKKMV